MKSVTASTLLRVAPLFFAALADAISGQSCCDRLHSVLPNRVLPRSDNSSSLYTHLNLNRWSTTAILSPRCIFTPSTAEEVAEALRALTAAQCHFALKSGGHMVIPGFNSIDDGVSIDLVYLNQTSIADDRSYVRLGAGSTWSNAYDNFVHDKIAFPGGLCGTTGVAGLALGGGESYFQPKVGWTIDNILEYELVLASGEIVYAREDSHPDLFRALKGGSSNFGIVTRVDVAAFEYGEMWAGQIIVPAGPTQIEQALTALHGFTEANNDNVDAGFQLVFEYKADGHRLIDMAVASTDGSVEPEILKPMTSIQPRVMSTLKTRTVSDTVQEVELVQPAGYRQVGATITFVNDRKTLEAVQRVTDEIYAKLAHVPGLDYIFFYVPQPRVIQKYSKARGGNVLGLDNVENDQIVMLFTPRWSDASYDEEMYEAAKEWYSSVKRTTEELGTDFPFLYLNFASDFQDPFCGYGAENVRFLQETAKKYDPEGVFQTLLPGGFKISEACKGGRKRRWGAKDRTQEEERARFVVQDL